MSRKRYAAVKRERLEVQPSSLLDVLEEEKQGIERCPAFLLRDKSLVKRDKWRFFAVEIAALAALARNDDRPSFGMRG